MIVELAASQFLARIGAQGIPLYYLLNAAVSIPFATLFSSVIDRFPRRQLFAYGLGLFTIIMIVLPVLPPIGKALPYANYLIVRDLRALDLQLLLHPGCRLLHSDGQQALRGPLCLGYGGRWIDRRRIADRDDIACRADRGRIGYAGGGPDPLLRG
jgi:hypothetical protein